jgi:hypothetical protein
LDPQHIISSLNNRGRNGSPHRLGASESFRALLFHADLESSVSNSKKIEKMPDLCVPSFYVTYMWEKIQTLRKIVYQKVPSQK